MTKFGELLKPKRLKLADVAERTGFTEAYLKTLIDSSTESLTVKEATILAHLIDMPSDEFMKAVKPSLIKTPPALRSIQKS
ncbi:MAG: hypothetical protein SFU91_07915 [Chloroherpetonaceae bacterium]|nr:hypothetical protein [Chloroherpetonaceae bacterium]